MGEKNAAVLQPRSCPEEKTTLQAVDEYVRNDWLNMF